VFEGTQVGVKHSTGSYRSIMAQSTPPGISDLLGLFGGANPFAAITKSIGQFQRGVTDFLSAVENFNKTMQQLHGVAERVNSLLDTVEEPIRAFVPQVTKTIKAADAMVDQLSGPIDRVAPGLGRLADVLSSPALMSLPTDLGEFMEVLSDLAHKLQPLGQMAESAGSLFGLRPFASLLGSTPPPPAPAPKPVVSIDPAKQTPATKAAARKVATKKAAAPAKRAAAKKR
jgi:ABC-type transporter Mla subunit MlaD